MSVGGISVRQLSRTLTKQVNNLKGGKVILAHGFRDISPRTLGAIPFGPVVRQNIMAGVHGRAQCSPHGMNGRDKIPQFPLGTNLQ